MSTYDDRIVRMGFDNAKFESGAAKTMSTLDKLTEKLKFKSVEDGTKNLQRAVNDIDFSSIQRGIEAVERRFSTMGIVGMNVINKITNGITSSVAKLEQATIGQIKSGGWSRAMNIANAKFQIEGLGFAWEEVEKAVSYGVKDTAYGLDAAASAASQLAASGVDFKKVLSTVNGQELTAMHKSLRAISGVAAMTNSSYEDISRIFTTVAGNGRLMGDQLLQLSSRGMNAAAKLAETLGTTEGEIRDMVSKGKIDFQTFAFAMDDAFGDHAKEANKTFTGALGNMKAALSRVGEIFSDPIINKTNTLFISLTERIDEFKNKLKSVKVPKSFEEIKNEYGEIAHNAAAYNEIVKANGEKVVTFGKHFAEMWQSGIDAFSAMIKSVDLSWFDKIVEKVDSVTVKINGFFDLIKEIYGESAEEAAEEINDATKTLLVSAEEAQAAHDIIERNLYGSGAQRHKSLVKAFGDDEEAEQHAKNVQAYVDSVLAAGGDYEKATIKVEDANERLSKSQGDLGREVKRARLKLIIDNITGGISNLWITAKNLAAAAKKIAGSILTAFSNIFNIKFESVTDSTLTFTEALVKLSKKLIISDDTATKITTVFEKFFGVIKIGVDILKKAAEFAKDFATSIGESKTFEAAKKAFSGLFDKITAFGDVESTDENPVIKTLNGILDAFDNLVSSHEDSPSKFTTFINNIIAAVTNVEWGELGKFASLFVGVYLLVKVFDALKSLGNLFTSIASLPANLGSFFSNMGLAAKKAASAYTMSAIAKSILLVAISIIAISYIPEEDLYRSIGTIIVIALVIKSLMKTAMQIGEAQTSIKSIVSAASSAFSMIKAIYSISVAIVAIAGAVAIMGIGLAIIEKSKPSGESFDILMGILAGVVIATTFILGRVKSLNIKQMVKIPVALSAISLMMVALGSSILLISAGIATMARVPNDVLEHSILLIAVILDGMAIIVNSVKNAKPSQLLSASVTFSAIGAAISGLVLSVGTAILLVSSAFKMLPKFDDQFGKSVIALGAMFAFLLIGVIALITMANAMASKMSDAFTIPTTLASMSLLVMAMSASILVISAAMRIIGSIPTDVMDSAIAAIALIFGGMTLIIFMSKDLTIAQAGAASLLMFAISGAMATMAVAIGIISLLKPNEDTIDAVKSLILVTTIIFTAIALLSKLMSGDNASVKNMTLMILSFEGLFIAIAGALFIISKIKDVESAAVALGGVLAVFAVLVIIVGAIAAISAYTGNSDSLKAAADLVLDLSVAMIALSAAVFILSLALSKMSDVDGDILVGFLVFIGIFTVAIGVLIGFAAAMPQVAVAIEAVGNMFLRLGVGAALVGVGFYLVAAAVAKLAPSVAVLALGLGTLFNVIEEHKVVALVFGAFILLLVSELTVMIVAFSRVLSGLVEAIGNAVTMVLGAINRGSKGVNDKLDSDKKGISTKAKTMIVTVITTLCAAILKASPTVLDTIGQLIIKLFKWLGKISGTLAEAIVDFVIELIYGVTDAINRNADRIAAAFWGLFLALVDIGVNVIGRLITLILDTIADATGWDWAKKASEWVGEKMGTISGKIIEKTHEMRAEAEEAAKAKNELVDAYEGVAEGMEGASDRVDKASDKLFSVFGSTSSKTEETKNSLQSLREEYANLPGYALDAMLSSQNGAYQWKKTGVDSGEAFTEGLMSNIPGHGGGGGSWDVSAAGFATETGYDEASMEYMGESASTSMAYGLDQPNEYNTAMTDNMTATNQAIVDNQDDVEKAIKYNINDPATAKIRENRPYMYDAAMYCVDGYTSALTSQRALSQAQAAAIILANATNASFTGPKGINSNSPSKVYYKFGTYMVQGLCNAIYNNADLAAESMVDLSDTIVSAFGSPFERIGQIVDGDLAYDASIRPVFDGSSVYDGMSSVNGMLNNQTVTVAGMSGKLSADIGQLDTTNSSMVEQLMALREEMAVMTDEMTNMKVVMDTGALVGQMAGPMDRTMGQRAIYKRRGN